MYRVNEIKAKARQFNSANYLIMSEKCFSFDDNLMCEIQDIDTEERHIASLNEMFELFKCKELAFQVNYKGWYIVTISTLAGARLAKNVECVGQVELVDFRSFLPDNSLGSFDDWFQRTDTIVRVVNQTSISSLDCSEMYYLESLDLCAPTIYEHRHDNNSYASALYFNYTSPFNADDAEVMKNSGDKIPLSFFTNLIDFYFLNKNKFFLCGNHLVMKYGDYCLYCFNVGTKFLIEAM